MALSFVAASSQLISNANAVASPPFTVSAWIRPITFTTPLCIFSMFGSSSDRYYSFWYRGDMSSGTIQAQCWNGGNNPSVNTTTAFSALGWHHVAGTYFVTGGSFEVEAWLDGGGYANNTQTPFTPPTVVNSYIGANGFTPNFFFNGRIAEVALFNVRLTSAEVAALAAGVNPYMVRPGSLVGYWPLWGVSPEPDLSGLVHNMTLTNTPTLATHAPVALFTPRWPTFLAPPAAADTLLGRQSLIMM